MAKFGPEYEKQAVEVKRALFEKFITTNPDVPTTLLEVGAGTLPNAAYYTVSMPGNPPGGLLAYCSHESLSAQ